MERDANSRLFHTSTINRRRRNKILALYDEVRNWIEGQQEIKENIYQFYFTLYTTEHQSSSILWQSTTYNTQILSTRDQSNMNALLRISEIKTATFSFKPTKALGPDSLHLLFYQRYWNVLEDKVTNLCK